MQSRNLPLAIIIALVLLCAVSWSSYAQRSKTRKPAWEYKVTTFSNLYGNEKSLNEIGAQGWELVEISDLGGIPTYFFKRPK